MRNHPSYAGHDHPRQAPVLKTRRAPRKPRAGRLGLYAGFLGLALTSLSLMPSGQTAIERSVDFAANRISLETTGTITARSAKPAFNAVYSELMFGSLMQATNLSVPTFGAPIRAAALEAPLAAPATASAAPAPLAEPQQVASAPVEIAPQPEAIPLPPVNPFRNRAGRTVVARAPMAAPLAAPAAQEEPGFFSRIFGANATPSDPEAGSPAAPAAKRLMAYAPLNDDRVNPLRDLSPFRQNAPQEKTAYYVINDRTVYMPDGSKLEAHSGLGPKMDDPRYVHVRMAGATPPNTYNLTMRERLFHGVEAIRMLPVEKGKMFGRDGILAHSYLLGPRGDSHGCVSFKDYNKFLNAFKRGEVTRIVVVADASSMLAMNSRR